VAVVAEINRWSAAAVDWSDTSVGGQPYEQNEKIRTWITAVNANPSNTSRQLEMWKDETTSTSESTDMGFVIKLGYANNTNSFYFGNYGTSTSWDIRISDAWLDNGSSSGYGNYATTGYYIFDSQSRSLSGTADADLYMIYDTEDGKEFICWGWGSTTANTEDWNMIYKTNHGEWMALSNDGSSTNSITYDNDAAIVCAFKGSVIVTGSTSTRISQNPDATSSRMFRVISSESGSAVSAAGAPSIPFTHAANPKIGHMNSAVCGRAGQYTVIDTGTADETLLCCTGYLSPLISTGTFSYFTTV